MVVFLLQVDERGVKEVCTFNPSTQGVEHYQYPLAGSKNTTSILKLLEFHFTSSGEVRSPPYTHTHTHTNTYKQFLLIHKLVSWNCMFINSVHEKMP